MPDHLPVNQAVSRNDAIMKITLHLDSPRQKFLASFLMSMGFGSVSGSLGEFLKIEVAQGEDHPQV